MKIIMDGSKLCCMIREENGLHLYFQERDPTLPEDKIILKNLEDFHPKPIVEIVMPKEKTPALLVAALMCYLSDDEKLTVMKELFKAR